MNTNISFSMKQIKLVVILNCNELSNDYYKTDNATRVIHPLMFFRAIL